MNWNNFGLFPRLVCGLFNPRFSLLTAINHKQLNVSVYTHSFTVSINRVCSHGHGEYQDSQQSIWCWSWGGTWQKRRYFRNTEKLCYLTTPQWFPKLLCCPPPFVDWSITEPTNINTFIAFYLELQNTFGFFFTNSPRWGPSPCFRNRRTPLKKKMMIKSNQNNINYLLLFQLMFLKWHFFS